MGAPQCIQACDVWGATPTSNAAYFSDNTDLVLASVDISTSAGAREAMNSVGSVIDRMSKTQVILGA